MDGTQVILAGVVVIAGIVALATLVVDRIERKRYESALAAVDLEDEAAELARR